MKLSSVESRTKRRIHPGLLQAAKRYVEHIDDYASEASGKRERDLDNKYQGLFLDFKRDPETRSEMLYVGETLNHYLKPYPTLLALTDHVADAVLEVLRQMPKDRRKRKPKAKREGREVLQTQFFGRRSEYWFQERHTDYPAGKPYILFKRVDKTGSNHRNASP